MSTQAVRAVTAFLQSGARGISDSTSGRKGDLRKRRLVTVVRNQSDRMGYSRREQELHKSIVAVCFASSSIFAVLVREK
jgi:hypothetical protein